MCLTFTSILPYHHRFHSYYDTSFANPNLSAAWMLYKIALQSTTLHLFAIPEGRRKRTTILISKRQHCNLFGSLKLRQSNEGVELEGRKQVCASISFLAGVMHLFGLSWKVSYSELHWRRCVCNARNWALPLAARKMRTASRPSLPGLLHHPTPGQ